MGLPTSGPHYDNYTSFNYYRYKARYRQAKPYDRPLPYVVAYNYITARSSPDWGEPAGNLLSWTALGHEAEVHNKAYERFLAKVTSRADISETILERQQARDMITARLMQLAKGAKELRQLRLGDAAKTFGLKKVPRNAPKHARAKSFSGLWLEYQLGWFPLVMSIFGLVDFLQQPINSVFIKARAQGTFREEVTENAGEMWEHRWTNTVVYREQLQAEVRISNPDLWLANNLGLVNPMSALWAITTLSFVVDWFVNVGDFIASSTDFVGLELIHPTTTISGKTTHITQWPGYSRSFEGFSVWAARSHGISGPTLAIKPFKGLSWQRGLTAVSLLLQQLR